VDFKIMLKVCRCGAEYGCCRRKQVGIERKANEEVLDII